MRLERGYRLGPAPKRRQRSGRGGAWLPAGWREELKEGGEAAAGRARQGADGQEPPPKSPFPPARFIQGLRFQAVDFGTPVETSGTADDL